MKRQKETLSRIKRRATAPIWNVDIQKIDYHIIGKGIRCFYLKPPAPQRASLKEKLLNVPDDNHTRKL